MGAGIEDQMAELDMDRYDEEEGEEGGASAGGRIFGGGNPGMTYYKCAMIQVVGLYSRIERAVAMHTLA